MFTSRHGRQRRVGLQQTYSPSPPPHRPPRPFSARVHATADFTEADDDEEDEDDDFDQGLGDGQDHDDEDAVDDFVDADQQGPGGLPVIPLFSSTHLGTHCQSKALCRTVPTNNAAFSPRYPPCL